MRCAEFEARLNRLLDERMAPGLDPAIVEHARTCFACSELLSTHESLLVGVRSMSAVRLRQTGERSLARRVMAEMQSTPPVFQAEPMPDERPSAQSAVVHSGHRSWSLAIGMAAAAAAVLLISVIARQQAPIPPGDQNLPDHRIEIAQPAIETSTMVAKAPELEPIAWVGYHVADGLSQVTNSMVSALRELRKRPLFRNTEEQPRSSHYSPAPWEEGLA